MAVNEPAALTITTAAALQVSRPALSSLFNGKAGLSGCTALRIEAGSWKRRRGLFYCDWKGIA